MTDEQKKDRAYTDKITSDLAAELDKAPEAVKNRKGKWIEESLRRDFIILARYNFDQIFKDVLKEGEALEELNGKEIIASLDQADTHNIQVKLCFEFNKDIAFKNNRY